MPRDKLPDKVECKMMLTPFEYHLLTIWARNHGQATSTYAAQIISARLEANFGWTPEAWNERMNAYYDENDIS